MAGVAVLTPLYRPPTGDEEISLAHLVSVLGSYERFLFVPAGFDPGPSVRRQGFRVEGFDPRHFRDVLTYSKLLLSVPFYERFSSYEHVLIYQPDCLVFRDELEAWCGAGYDYLGAPWFRSRGAPERGLSRAGNGGFSLRRVAACLDVLRSRRRVGPSGFFTARLPDLAGRPIWQRWWKTIRVLWEARRGAATYAAGYTLNEDHFWSDRARLFDPRFRVAPPEVALAFAFESAPRTCYELHRRRLPFGCHAWTTWDRDFWEPHLLTAGAAGARIGP